MTKPKKRPSGTTNIDEGPPFACPDCGTNMQPIYADNYGHRKERSGSRRWLCTRAIGKAGFRGALPQVDIHAERSKEPYMWTDDELINMGAKRLPTQEVIAILGDEQERIKAFQQRSITRRARNARYRGK